MIVRKIIIAPWPVLNTKTPLPSHSASAISSEADLAWPHLSSQVTLTNDGTHAQLRSYGTEEVSGQGTVMGLREYSKTEVHSWTVRFEQNPALPPANFLVGVAPPSMDLNKSLGEEGCGIGEQVLSVYAFFVYLVGLGCILSLCP